MFSHIGLHVKDLAGSVRFYEAALDPLGYKLCTRDETSASFGPPDAPELFLYVAKRSTGPGVHLALNARNHRAVQEFHERGRAAGGKEHGAPGVRADYAPTYYAAFLLDPDGNNVEAVCLAP